jgi:ribosomal protein L24
METRNTAKSNVRKNDQVIVTAGKELGKKGKVLKVYPKKTTGDCGRS